MSVSQPAVSKLIFLYYHGITMRYANVSVKFPAELDREVEAFLEETGIYTNKSEFIKESVRRHLIELNEEPAIAALRTEQLLARAEREPISDDELRGQLAELQDRIDETDLEDAVDEAREKTAGKYFDQA